MMVPQYSGIQACLKVHARGVHLLSDTINPFNHTHIFPLLSSLPPGQVVVYEMMEG